MKKLMRVTPQSVLSMTGEEVGKHEEYAGRRIERGLFITKEGRKENADINGKLNILKKSKTKDRSVISRLMNSGVTTPVRRLVL